MIKIGDKVRFLNATGEGVVVGFQSKEVALVRDADEFDMPTHIRDLVVICETNQYNFPTETEKPTTSQRVDNQQIAEEQEPEIVIPPYAFNESDETPEGEKISLYLAFVPTDVKQLQTCDTDVYLVNDSNFYLNFNLLTTDVDSNILVQNNIEPQTKLLLTTIAKTELNAWETLRLQAFAYKNHPFSPKPAIDIELKINATRFYKLHSFGASDFFDEPTMTITIVENDVFQFEVPIDAQTIQQAIRDKEKPRRQPIRKVTKRPEPLEIDLHINQLLDTTAGMSAGEMLQYQLNKFHEVMNENRRNRGQKIIFIHGKGEGVLRAAIEKELKTRYRTCQFQDASFQQYGFGATQVTVR